MTEPAAPDAHLGLDRIADLEEGLLSPAEAQAAREHLAGCDLCQGDLAALAAVHEALLGDAEITMPDDVAARVYGALAELPPLAPAVAAPTTLPVRSGPSRWERSRKPLLATLAAAAAVALLTLGIIRLPHSSGSSASSAAVTSAAAAAAPTSAAAPQILHSGHDYDAKTLGSDGRALVAPPAAAAATSGAAAGVTSAAAAAPTSAAVAGPTLAAAAPTAAAAPAPASGAAPTSGGAASGAAATTSSAAGITSAAPAAPAATTDALSQLRDPGAAQRCIALLLGSTTAPLVIDYATFAGKPAVIAVVDDPKDAGKLAVIAVGPPGCALYSLNFVSKP